MRRRPMWFILLALAFFGVAISLPLQIMMIYGHGLSEISAVFDKLTLLNWLVLCGTLICSGLVWRASPYLRYAVPLLIALVAINNFFVGYYATDFSMASAS